MILVKVYNRPSSKAIEFLSKNRNKLNALTIGVKSERDGIILVIENDDLEEIENIIDGSGFDYDSEEEDSASPAGGAMKAWKQMRQREKPGKNVPQQYAFNELGAWVPIQASKATFKPKKKKDSNTPRLKHFTP